MIHLMSHAQYTWSSLECLMMCDYLRPDQLIDHQTVIKTKDFLEWVGVEKSNLEGLKLANFPCNNDDFRLFVWYL